MFENICLGIQTFFPMVHPDEVSPGDVLRLVQTNGRVESNCRFTGRQVDLQVLSVGGEAEMVTKHYRTVSFGHLPEGWAALADTYEWYVFDDQTGFRKTNGPFASFKLKEYAGVFPLSWPFPALMDIEVILDKGPAATHGYFDPGLNQFFVHEIGQMREQFIPPELVRGYRMRRPASPCVYMNPERQNKDIVSLPRKEVPASGS